MSEGIFAVVFKKANKTYYYYAVDMRKRVERLKAELVKGKSQYTRVLSLYEEEGMPEFIAVEECVLAEAAKKQRVSVWQRELPHAVTKEEIIDFRKKVEVVVDKKISLEDRVLALEARIEQLESRLL